MGNLDGSIYNALVAAKLASASGGGGGNIASNNVTAMTGYEEAETAAAITTSDTLNQAVGKLEKGVDDNKNNISTLADSGGVKNLAPLNTATTPNTGYFGTTSVNLPADTYTISFKLTTAGSFGIGITVDGSETAKNYASPPYSDTLITLEITANTSVTAYRFYANGGATVNDFMICTKAQWDISHTYQPYAMSISDITAWIQAHT